MVRKFWLVTILLLAGCVTQTDTPLKEVDKDEVVRRQVDLGIGYLRRAEYGRAKENLSKALQYDPRSGLAHTTFGVVFQQEGELALAEDHFKKAIKYEPDLSQARNNYGAFLFSQNRYKEAIAQLQVAADDRFYAARPAVFENLGRSYMQINDLGNAEASFERAIALNPNQARASLELSEIRFGQKRNPESFRLYQQHIKVSQHSARSLWLCVRLAEVFSNEDDKASCALTLKNIFPASREFAQYKLRYGP